ncbi:protease [Dyella dinghuensis]|uniref:Protease n=1 Tax=Dyella dinghuensis TaxID=1920169 RepID=A0A3S0PD79_9GAMM|nr:S8 family serine peptidase [Dyella dinghuensis]RUL62328.1 protease [Dyella dinghuensis]
MKSLHSFRIGALAAAMVLAIPALHAADLSKSSPRFIGVGQAGEQSFDRFIITYKNGSTERSNKDAVLQNVKAAVSRAGLDRATKSSTGATTASLSVSYKRKLAVGSDLVRTSRKLSQSEADALVAQLAADPAVASVQRDYKRYAVKDFAAPASLQATMLAAAQPQAFTPNDPYYQQYQWNFFNATGGADVNNAWDIADGSGVTVAVIDTGITQHPDLDYSLATNNIGYDFITDSFVSGRTTDDRVPGGWDLGDWDNTQPYLQECYGSNNPNDGEPSSWHGTVVSGEVAELTNNGLGMAGVAYNAKVLPVRVLGHCGGYDSDISDAIEWASGGHIDGVPDLAQPAQVINMSLGGQGTCDASVPEYTAIKDAISRGTTVVVAAGNSTADVSNFTPASCPGVVAVASNGITGKRAFYSNYGKGVTISAPGGGIYANDASSGTEVDNGFVWQAINEGTTTPTYPADPTEAYGGMAGTSQASPHVAGTVALVVGALKEAGLPALSPADMTNVLVKSARAFPVTEDHPIGAGIVDANAAVNLALNNDNPPPSPGDDATPLTKGVLLSGQNSTSTGNLYSIVVPAGATTLNIRTLGGSGNVGLYVKAGSAPSANGSNADFSSIKPGTSEAVVIPQPQATTYYILVTAPQGSFNNISVLADYNQ